MTSIPDLASLLLLGPLPRVPAIAPDDLRPGSALLEAAAWSAVPPQPSKTLLAAEFAAWPSLAGEAPDLPLLAWSLQEDDEEMELILAGLEAGKRLEQLGASMLIGPDLSPQVWRSSPELTARASGAFLQGLSAAGLILCADSFPAASIEEITGDLRAFPHAFASGLDALRLGTSAADPKQAPETCRMLRQELGFSGVILARAIEPADAPRLLQAGCDLIQTPEAPSALLGIDAAVISGELSSIRLKSALGRAQALFAD